VTKKRAARKGEGAPKGNQNAAKGIKKKLVSARVELVIYERLAKDAWNRGQSISAQVAEVLTERYSPFPEDVSD
jgi:hypothetical protein